MKMLSDLVVFSFSVAALTLNCAAQTIRNTHASIGAQSQIATSMSGLSLQAYFDSGSTFQASGQTGLNRRVAPPGTPSYCEGGWECRVGGVMPWNPLSPRSPVFFPIVNCANIGGATYGQITAAVVDVSECNILRPCSNGSGPAYAAVNSGSSSTEQSSVSLSIFGGSEVRSGYLTECGLAASNYEAAGCLSVQHVWNVTDFEVFNTETTMTLAMDIATSFQQDASSTCDSVPESKKKANASITVRVQGPNNYDKTFTFVLRSSARSQPLIQTSSSFPLLGTLSNGVWNYDDDVVSFVNGVSAVRIDGCVPGVPSCSCEQSVRTATLQLKDGANNTSEPRFTLNPSANGIWTIAVRSSAISADIDFGGAGDALVDPGVCAPGDAPSSCSTLQVTQDPDGLTDYRDLIRVGASEGSQGGSCRYISRVDLDGNGTITQTEVDESLCAEMADINLDGFVDFFDYDAYIVAFELGDCLADVNKDGFLDFFDFDRFVYVFYGAPDCTFIVSAGCATVE
jgi:hypothetical protein